MNDMFHHEELYRPQFNKIKDFGLITVCGVGAVGSNLVDSLSRQGFSRFRVIDMDRVEKHNINNQIYNRSHIGTLKVAAVKNMVFQSVGIEVEAESKELTDANVKKLLKGSSLVIDAFDNTKARQCVTSYCLNNNIPCLHIGLATDYAEVIWNENYKVPQFNSDIAPCDVPLARNVVMLSVAVASEEIINFTINNSKSIYYIALNDLDIRKIKYNPSDIPEGK